MTCSILLMNINRFKQKLHTWLKMTNFHHIQNIPAKQEQVDKKKNFQEMLCGTGESRIMIIGRGKPELGRRIQFQGCS